MVWLRADDGERGAVGVSSSFRGSGKSEHSSSGAQSAERGEHRGEERRCDEAGRWCKPADALG